MNVTVLKYVPTGVDCKPRGSCDGCGDAIWSEGALKVAGIPGLYCGVGCVENLLVWRGSLPMVRLQQGGPAVYFRRFPSLLRGLQRKLLDLRSRRPDGSPGHRKELLALASRSPARDLSRVGKRTRSLRIRGA
jgi:hypothetical protein